MLDTIVTSPWAAMRPARPECSDQSLMNTLPGSGMSPYWVSWMLNHSAVAVVLQDSGQVEAVEVDGGLVLSHGSPLEELALANSCRW